MTNLITLTIPNDDRVALRAFGKALEEMALAHGASPTQLQVVNEITMSDKQRETLKERLLNLRRSRSPLRSELETAPAEQIDALVKAGKEVVEKDIAELDTTAQQVESLAPFKIGEVTLAVDEVSGDLEPVADKSGTPWDERIHSTSKALNADGTWRLRRKPKDMDEEQWAAFVETVKAELSEGLETPAEAYLTDDFVVSVASAPHDVDPDTIPKEDFKEVAGFVEPPVTPLGDDFHTDADVVTEQTVAGIPPLPVPPPVVVAPPVPEVTTWDFPHLMTFLTERHGKIDVATVNTLLAQDGMSSVQELNAHPDKIGPFVARVKAHLGE